MIVYSDRKRSEDPRGLLASLRRRLSDAAPDPVAMLIEAGVLEAALVDALSPGEDDEPPLARALRAVTLDLAHAARGHAGAEARLDSALRGIEDVERGPLPGLASVTEPEGFAFYALYPETYAEAARRFLRAARPERATVVGLRSIGTTLSAVVAAELEAGGVPVRSLTVRPRGHPFERELHLGPRLLAALEEGAAGHVLVVDEGPGISGSSFACAAEAAIRAGVPEHRIALFPSWDSDGAGLRSERARALWPRLGRWTAGFEETFIDGGRLAAPWGGGSTRDLSGGLWRERLCSPGRFPAVQPQHERRKYLVERDDGPLLLKFAGLGARGARALVRAEAQAEAGLAPEVVGLANGFLAHRFEDGRPAEALDAELLGAMTGYLAQLAAGPASGPARFDDLLAMTRLNVAEGLGPAAAGRTGWMEGLRGPVLARPALAGDGRMLPYEWLRTGAGVLKCDGIDHHDDHFWPGAQDIAWDLAGAVVEFGMGAEARERLLAGFRARSGDGGAREVLPFYEVAYLAWRLGYTTLAAETLGGSDDGLRMGRARDRYAALLRGALEREAA
ncbi:hypothetical protein Rumeso_03308 [Rubellimicrobium mesophilum DSM 19309]|uniref:Uncharacterized protein n=1 Tax=Rubellimicrobium mesophilum DSM 19309 TaxID=442562 RepID=A0A017HL33_9RHOB|nr:hypothetical protein [Rubellimicrobium mesophilum]EYD75212.1 hypothetical protein Rumeso_03308 [Rubellimicrobium mesophilum DSM 19309]